MCGIAGIVDLKGRPPEQLLVERLCARLAHRGPDDEGYYLKGAVALGQRRLSIIDLASGRQPMGNEDGTVWVTFNGEIYNYQELRERLEALDHHFATHSDTEVIVHAYEQYGERCLQELRGMFALALWDEAQRTLLLARDRVGKKPLFYALVDGQLVFASELQALLQHPALSREVDPAAIDEYLTYGYVPAPRTAFKGIFKLPPAHYLVLRTDEGAGTAGPTIRSYWQLAFTPKQELDEEQAAEGLLEVLTEAVRLRLIADVPVGALLSGGIDSSLVVALMSQLSSRPVQTFSIGFEERDFDELRYARLVAQRYETDHHEFMVRPNALEVLPSLVRHYGEPFADSSALPTYYVARLTRQHVKVALNGDGADESFGGYERYLGSLLAERYQQLPEPLRKGLGRSVCSLIPGWLPRRSRLSQLRRFLEAAELPLVQRYLRWVSYFTREQKELLYTPDFQRQLAQHDGGAWLSRLFERFCPDSGDHLDALMAVDVHAYLPYDLLVKMDIATMANSLEARSPFLDHKVMEFAARLPCRYKIRGRTLKYLLKRAGGKLLPAEILSRRKMGFGVPVGHWMRQELRPLLEDVLLSPAALIRNYFQDGALRRFVQAHLDGKQDHSSQLWALLWLGLWHQEFLG